MKSRTFRRISTYLFLTMAYGSCLLQWLWVTIVALPLLLENGTLDVLMSDPQSGPAPSLPVTEHSPILWVAAGIVTILVLIMTVVVLIRLPRAIVRSGEFIVHQTTEAVVPIVTHHQPVPKKKQLIVSQRIRMAIQTLLVLIPVVISIFLPADGQLTGQIIVLVSLWLAGFSAVGFVVSWLLSDRSTSTSRTR